MRWRGETKQEYETRVQTWQTAFAWLPKEMNDGTRVWLETYEWLLHDPFQGTGWSGIKEYVSRPTGSDWEPERITRPAPPSATRPPPLPRQ